MTVGEGEDRGRPDEVTVVEVPQGKERSARLSPILEESFEGLYRWHAERTIKEIEVVRSAQIRGRDIGVMMLKVIAKDAGYVYYIAVSKSHRRMGVGGRLLDSALEYFAGKGAVDVFASVEEDNFESARLFSSRGFVRSGRGYLAGRYGRLRSVMMYREMMVVPGEVLLRRDMRDLSFNESRV